MNVKPNRPYFGSYPLDRSDRYAARENPISVQGQSGETGFKLVQSPDSLTLGDFRLIQAQESDSFQGQSHLMAKSLKGGYRRLSKEEQDAIAANRRLGVMHKRKMIQNTPVWGVTDPQEKDKPLSLNITLQKVNVPGTRTTDIAIRVNKALWKFQPVANHKLSSFFMAHDIERHLVLNRSRSTNLTNTSGEYNTGQVLSTITASPADLSHFDGLIANVASQRMEDETGDFTFKKLQHIIRYFRRNEFPVGARVEIHYKMPPPDICYVSAGEKPNRRVCIMNDGGQANRTGVIALSQLKLKFKELMSDPTVQTVTQTRVFNNDTIDVVRPLADNSSYQEYYRFLVDSESQPTLGRKYCRLPDGHLVLWTEGMLIKRGLQPVKTEDDGKSRIYVVEKNNSLLRFKFTGQDLTSPMSANLLIFHLMATNFKPVYSGEPYQPIQISSIDIKLPKEQIKVQGDEINHKTRERRFFKFSEKAVPYNANGDSESKEGLIKACQDYQKAFDLYQQYFRDALEAGTLPLDVRLTNAPDGGTLLDEYNKLKDAGFIDPDAPRTVPVIQQGILKREIETYKKLYPEVNAILEKNDPYVAPFPPPPFKTEFMFQTDTSPFQLPIQTPVQTPLSYTDSIKP